MTARRVSCSADRDDRSCHQSKLIPTPYILLNTRLYAMLLSLLSCSIFVVTTANIATEDLQFLNELPLQNLLRLKNSLHELVTAEYDNITSPTTPSFLESFGAQAMAIKAPPLRRGDYEEGVYNKKDHFSSKISNIFSMSVTTLAFLAFGGYLLCLIVQAVKAKQMYNFNQPAVPVPQPTFLLSSGIKKRPQTQFASYGRRRRDARAVKQIDLPPDQLFSALLKLCEGYAKWSERYGDTGEY